MARPESVPILAYIMEQAQKTAVYRIIDNIYHGRIQTLQHAAEECYVSGCTLRHMIGHINNVLASFDVAISTAALDLIGREADIRYFLFTFFADFRDCFIAGGKREPCFETYGDILCGPPDGACPRLHVSYFRAAVWVMVQKERVLHHHYVSLTAGLIKEVVDRESYREQAPFFQAVFRTVFGITTLPQAETVWAYVVALHCVSYTEQGGASPAATARGRAYRREERAEIVDQIRRFLYSELGEDMMQGEAGKRLSAFLINLRLLARLTPQFERVSLPLGGAMKESLSDHYHRWCAHIKHHKRELPYVIEHKKDVAVTLSMLHLPVLERQHDRVIHVLFAFQGEPGYDDILAQAADRLIPKNVHAAYVFDQPVTVRMIVEKKAELVVCNYAPLHLDSSPIRVVRLSYLPTVMEWTALRGIMLRLSQRTPH